MAEVKAHIQMIVEHVQGDYHLDGLGFLLLNGSVVGYLRDNYIGRE